MEGLEAGLQRPADHPRAYKNPDQVRAYVQTVRRKGTGLGNGVWRINQIYQKKQGIGRLSTSALSLQGLEKEARQDALTFDQDVADAVLLVWELDQHHSFPANLAAHLDSLLTPSWRGDFPFFESYADNAPVWKMFLCQYYGEDDSSMKKLMLSIMFPKTRLAPQGRCDSHPFLDTLYQEIREIEDLLDHQCPLYNQCKTDRPDKNHLAVLCGELESRSTLVAVDMLQKLEVQCFCLVYDGTYFNAHNLQGKLAGLLQELRLETGVRFHVKNLAGETVVREEEITLDEVDEDEAAPSDLEPPLKKMRTECPLLPLEEFGEVGNVVEAAAGSNSCLRTALRFLGKDLVFNKDGPECYKDLMESNPGALHFKPVGVNRILESGDYILHSGAKDKIGHAVGVQVKDGVADVCHTLSVFKHLFKAL